MELYYLSKDSLKRLINILLEENTVHTLRENNGDLDYGVLTRDDLESTEIIYSKYRAIQPIKSFFSLFSEDVTADKTDTRKRIIIGVKTCDLNALAVMDKMFMEGEFIDTYYKGRRENTIIISSDCTDAKDTCFCTLLGNNPFPSSGFDLNLSPSEEGFVVEAGSEKGRALVRTNRNIFGEEDKRLEEKRIEKRQKMKSKVENINKKFSLKKEFWKELPLYFNSEMWEETSGPCVECGACTNACPSCYCFLLSDIEGKPGFKKIKYWDSCQFTGYARVAGGANPRPKLFERFRNRYLCKYDYRPGALGLVACTGCGRCIECCQGKIDKREVLEKVMK